MDIADEKDLDDLIGDIDDNPLDLEFRQASDHIQRTHSQRTRKDLLELYAFYKQATVGKCNTNRPSIFSPSAQAKWIAWKDLGDMSIEGAKVKYAKKVQELDPEFKGSADEPSRFSFNWVVHSVHAQPKETEILKPEMERNAFDFLKDANLEKLKASIAALPKQLCELDENGMGLVHWAADRDLIEILSFLLDAGADVHFRDKDDQTALHYAACCGNIDSVRILLKHEADPLLMDVNGQSCVEVSDNDEIRSLLSTPKAT